MRRSEASRRAYAPDEFDRNSERGPSIETLHSVAHVMAVQGRDSECEIVLKKLIDTHPRFLNAYGELAELYMRRDERESARAALEAGLAVAPTDGVLNNNLGMLYLFDSEYEKALAHFTRASAADPADARSRANMATSLGLLGRLDEALAIYYLVVPPAKAHHNLGVLCRATGQDKRAEQEFARARKLK